jgi:Zn-finger nucleic acid-binding protein
MSEQFNCPVCNEGLVQTKIKGGGFVYLCAGKHGMALKELTLRKLLPNRAGLKIWNAALKISKTSGQNCPACSEKMVLLEDKLLSKDVEIDICKLCKIFWFDKGEYKKILSSLKTSLTTSSRVQPDRLNTKKGKAFSKALKLDDTLTLNSDFHRLFNLNPKVLSVFLAVIGLALSINWDMSNDHAEGFKIFSKTNINIFSALVFIHLHQFLPNFYKFGWFSFRFDQETLRSFEIWAYWLAWFDLVAVPIYFTYKYLG